MCESHVRRSFPIVTKGAVQLLPRSRSNTDHMLRRSASPSVRGLATASSRSLIPVLPVFRAAERAPRPAVRPPRGILEGHARRIHSRASRAGGACCARGVLCDTTARSHHGRRGSKQVRNVFVSPRSPRSRQETAFVQLGRENFLDLFAADSWRSVYAGELEVRPSSAPTTRGEVLDRRGTLASGRDSRPGCEHAVRLSVRALRTDRDANGSGSARYLHRQPSNQVGRRDL